MNNDLLQSIKNSSIIIGMMRSARYKPDNAWLDYIQDTLTACAARENEENISQKQIHRVLGKLENYLDQKQINTRETNQ